MVIVGCTLSDRPTICSPTSLKLCDAPWRRAWTRKFSLSLVPASGPTLRMVESIAALNSMPQFGDPGRLDDAIWVPQ